MAAPSPFPTPPLTVRGARQNNLAGFDLEIPHDCLAVVTGVSGSGKSSLAFDTVFAEGQWRFLESLPSYARLIVEKLPRPHVDDIANIRPAIALEQRNTVRSARSTVGTATELYDLFRVLYAVAGTAHCVACGAPVRAWSAAAAAADVADRFPGARLDVEVPLAALVWLDPAAPVADLQQRGFARLRLGAASHRLDSLGPDLELPADAALVLTRIPPGERARERLIGALDEAFQLADGRVWVRPAGQPPEVYGSRRRCHHCDRDAAQPRPVLFSFNHALGACPECTGFGAVLEWDPDKVIPDPRRTLAGGAVEPWQTPANRWWQEQLEGHAARLDLPLDTPWAELPEEVRRRVWEGGDGLEGITDFFSYLEGKRYKMHVRVFLARYRRPRTCPRCGGQRLRPEALAVTIAGHPISTVARWDLGRLGRWVEELSRSGTAAAARDLLWRIEEKLGVLLRLGLHYLTMDRATRTLSGGEAQRAALALQLQNHLAGTLYVLDEPTVGLHPRDVAVLGEVLAELAAQGNTVLAVEHDLDLIRCADHVVELGPGAGHRGGQVVYQGTVAGLAQAATATGAHLRAHSPPAAAPHPPRGAFLRLAGCHLHNLQEVAVDFPVGLLTCVTGVSGSGKSSLVTETLVPAAASQGLRGPLREYTVVGGRAPQAVRVVDQEPMGRTPRSIPLTYIGAYNAVRSLFAALPASRRLGLQARDFSFNVKGGRCERCAGSGYEKLEMLFFEDLFVPCEACGGRRFGAAVLSVRLHGHTIHDVLQLTVEEALEVFAKHPKVRRPLEVLARMGLDYLVLGQPAPTLSGGEAQRLKIAAELLGRKPRDVLYVFDEPTTGLHADDVQRLTDVLRELVAAGNTVVTVEHNLDLVAAADWVIDLGPEGGKEGGLVVDTGTPADVAERALGPTGQHLRRWFREVRGGGA